VLALLADARAGLWLKPVRSVAATRVLRGGAAGRGQAPHNSLAQAFAAVGGLGCALSRTTGLPPACAQISLPRGDMRATSAAGSRRALALRSVSHAAARLPRKLALTPQGRAAAFL